VPDLPTMQEAGVKGYEVVGWSGLLAPAHTPPDIVARLAHDLAKVLSSAEVKAQMTKLGAEPGADDPQRFAAFLQSEADRWGKIIRDKGIKPE
jgi:tripartite-type tricarboxylate transporter receptor subunit TctC